MGKLHHLLHVAIFEYIREVGLWDRKGTFLSFIFWKNSNEGQKEADSVLCASNYTT